MKHYQKVIFFLIVNFAALGLGNILQGEGPSGDWYQNLNQAPWTPPGWIFGAAWFFVMFCFSFFMAHLTKYETRNKLIALFSVQFFLNVIWNAIFFKHQMIGLALIIIISLAILIGYFLFVYGRKLKIKTLLIAPYFIWLCIATSLNIYMLWYN